MLTMSRKSHYYLIEIISIILHTNTIKSVLLLYLFTYEEAYWAFIQKYHSYQAKRAGIRPIHMIAEAATRKENCDIYPGSIF